MTQEKSSLESHLSVLDEVAPAFVQPKGGLPAVVLHRFDDLAERYYYRLSNGLLVGKYLSATETSKKALGHSKAIVEYYGKMGTDFASGYATMRATRGDILHHVIENLERLEEYSFERIYSDVFREAQARGYDFKASEWADYAVRAVAAWLQFKHDYDVEILACEYPVYSDRYGVAGCIDAPALMRWPKNSKKKRRVIIDHKFTNGLYESHAFQLEAYKAILNDMLEETGTGEPFTHIFNFRPTDWKYTSGKPGYQLKNWTNKTAFSKNIRSYLEMAIPSGWVNPPSGFFSMRGKFRVNGKFDIEQHLHHTEL